ncbi:hypothetical protein [Trichocoleus sp. FACHB-262]|uniref:hypothetical protein n=1 Tax=Trichocoleus sp. FACHB-262 TaxID=2692869 RepID=UPI001683F4CE|nr:hypothetical protein [Trichocoleus sp. FACHB-262]MBD2121015.1 hypothetical protein [Trichocoleus sp. FACHB-262]
MRIKLKEIAFANGAVFVDLYNLSFKVQAFVTLGMGTRQREAVMGGSYRQKR